MSTRVLSFPWTQIGCHESPHAMSHSSLLIVTHEPHRLGFSRVIRRCARQECPCGTEMCRRLVFACQQSCKGLRVKHAKSTHANRRAPIHRDEAGRSLAALEKRGLASDFIQNAIACWRQDWRHASDFSALRRAGPNCRMSHLPHETKSRTRLSPIPRRQSTASKRGPLRLVTRLLFSTSHI